MKSWFRDILLHLSTSRMLFWHLTRIKTNKQTSKIWTQWDNLPQGKIIAFWPNCMDGFLTAHWLQEHASSKVTPGKEKFAGFGRWHSIQLLERATLSSHFWLSFCPSAPPSSVLWRFRGLTWLLSPSRCFCLVLTEIRVTSQGSLPVYSRRLEASWSRHLLQTESCSTSACPASDPFWWCFYAGQMEKLRSTLPNQAFLCQIIPQLLVSPRMHVI